ncbi:hypothetical protein ACLOJK_026628 [Asimina triloba]
MVMGDGVLTPCISVLSSVGGIKQATTAMTEGRIVWISVGILICLFLVQRFGTDKVGYSFAPIIVLWFLMIGCIDIFNFVKYDPSVAKAFNPKYIFVYFRRNKKDTWISLVGVVLASTGTEAMFAELRHFTVRSIQISMCSLTFPCLVLAYAGQASYLREIAHHILYTGQCFAVAVAASIIASQAMISGTFSIIHQSLALGCFPLVKIVHSSSKYEGQTYGMLMTKFVATSDIDQMEATLKRLEDDPKVIAAWKVYSIAADCYKKVGILDKTVNMLKKSEAVVPLKQQRAACDFLLSRYSGMGLKDDVYRLWNLKCSISKKVSNASYICMLASLSNLDDIEGAEKVLEEWESKCFCDDFQVPNQLVAVYCKKGQFDKAESFIKRAIEGGRMPYPSTWEYLATGYINSNQIPKGLEMMKKAMSLKNMVGSRDQIMWLLVWQTFQGRYCLVLETSSIAGKSVSDAHSIGWKSRVFDVEETDDTFGAV